MISKVSIPTILYIQKRFSSILAVLAIILKPGGSSSTIFFFLM
uniref:Uncharacterized protein n=1 Tax=Lepeophtheirus salmonis TaxID=72036 RepID=A0A0K2UTN3_LEPSM